MAFGASGCVLLFVCPHTCGQCAVRNRIIISYLHLPPRKLEELVSPIRSLDDDENVPRYARPNEDSKPAWQAIVLFVCLFHGHIHLTLRSSVLVTRVVVA